MATRLEDEFDPTRINAPDAAYPAGSLKDETTPGVSDDGTPLASRVGNDWQGFSQSALDKAGILANGQPDSVSNPQILQAIEKMYNAGDSQLAGGNIWPLSSQETAQDGDDLTGYEYVRLQGGDFTTITQFAISKQDGSSTPISGNITNIDLNGAPYTATVGSDDVYLRVFKYFDGFEKANPREFGAIDGTDSTLAIQAFADFISLRKVDASCYGDYILSSIVTFNGSAGSLIDWGVKFTGDLTMTTKILHFESHSTLQHSGSLFVQGGGASPNYSDRVCVDGVTFNSCRGMKLADKTRAERFLRDGFQTDGVSNNTLLNLGDCRAHDCGSSTLNDSKLSVSFTNVVDTGSAGSTGQRSVLSMLTPPNVRNNDIINYKGYPHIILGFDASSITVYPWLGDSDTTGTVDFYIGAGIAASGADAAQIAVNSLDATRTGVALRQAQLYGVVGSRILTQFCGVAVVVGSDTTSSKIGGDFNGLYCEGNGFDVIQTTSAPANFDITGSFPLSLDKVIKLSPRNNDKSLRGITTRLDGATILKDGSLYSIARNSFGLGDFTTSYSVIPEGGISFIKGGNSVTIDFDIDQDTDRLFGYYGQQLVIHGNRANNGLDSATFTTSTASATVNNGASFVISPVSAPVTVNAFYDTINNNWVVIQLQNV